MQVTLFDLNLIRALDALLSERNVTRAAERLFVTQQAMSGSLRRLRDHFDDELLVRVGRHLEPTPLGAALRQPMRELLLQTEITLQIEPTFDPMKSERNFRVAMSDYAIMTYLPHFMPLLAARAPHMVCEIKALDDTVFDNVARGELDFCLLPSNARLYQKSLPCEIRSLTLFEDDFVCVVDARHPDIGATLSLDQYLTLPHNTVRLGAGMRSIVEIAWSARQLDVPISATAASFATLLFMVPGTRLVATAQRKLAQAFARMLPIRLVECPIPIENLTECLSWHARHQEDPAHVFLRELFLTAVGLMDETATYKPRL